MDDLMERMEAALNAAQRKLVRKLIVPVIVLIANLTGFVLAYVWFGWKMALVVFLTAGVRYTGGRE